jgi:predicted amidohydrolase
VRLAAVEMSGVRARTVAQAREAYAPMIAEAAAKRANFVCLTEALTSHHSGLKVEQAAEPIPGPSTEYFAALAQKHDLYIVAGLVERDAHLIHNTAVLVGPEGLVGKYRKVCLAANEASAWGVCSGEEFPVFPTRFGKVGMMICWDLQHPEVARALAGQGAEILFLSIAGGNPILASARAIENQVFLVVSAWNSSRLNWIKTGIYDYDGGLLDSVKGRGVAVAEVDLDAPRYWAHVGDLKGQIAHQRPVVAMPAGTGRISQPPSSPP